MTNKRGFCKYFGQCYTGILYDVNCIWHTENCIHEDAMQAVQNERHYQRERRLEQMAEDIKLQIEWQR